VSTPSTWRERPRDQANLFNPAFLAVLIERCAYGHRERSGEGIPWPLVFIALPVVLHRETREDLPKAVTSSMAAWTGSHALLVARLPERARALQPYVREALLFALAHGLVRLEGDRLLSRNLARPGEEQPWREPTEDFRSCATKAAFFGRWCAVAGLPATVFALWGVRP
jgi:hypothetical protein